MLSSGGLTIKSLSVVWWLVLILASPVLLPLGFYFPPDSYRWTQAQEECRCRIYSKFPPRLDGNWLGHFSRLGVS